MVKMKKRIKIDSELVLSVDVIERLEEIYGGNLISRIYDEKGQPFVIIEIEDNMEKWMK